MLWTVIVRSIRVFLAISEGQGFIFTIQNINVLFRIKNGRNLFVPRKTFYVSLQDSRGKGCLEDSKR